MKKYALDIAAFVCGAMIMVLELTASRILAPYFGTSNIIWTGIIGIILLSISMGTYLGGVISDKKPEYRMLGIVIITAGIWIMLLPVVSTSLLEHISAKAADIRIGAVLSAIVLFLAPSLALGTVSPFATKLRINDLKTVGKIAGRLSALSTLGSITGTFLAGFVLIPLIGSTQLLYIIGFVLISTAFIIYVPNLKKTAPIIVVALLLLAIGQITGGSRAARNVLDTDSQYGRIEIYDTSLTSGRPIRVFAIDSAFESAMFPDAPYELALEYTKYYDLMNYFHQNIENTLMIGGCGYSYPKHYLRQYTDRSMDVVEIDPKVTEIARDLFYLEESDRLRIYHQDGRIFLNETDHQYDVILNDAFRGNTPPFHLATKEASERIYQALNEDGVYLTNIMCSLEGEKSEILDITINTLSQVFPAVYLFPCFSATDTESIQNIMVVATKEVRRSNMEESGNGDLDTMIRNHYEKASFRNQLVITDDYAPLDYYIRSVLY